MKSDKIPPSIRRWSCNSSFKHENNLRFKQMYDTCATKHGMFKQVN